MDSQIKVIIKKCPIPIIWLDTSVIINMTKGRNKQTANQNNYRREMELFDVIYKKVREGKLICPQGDQSEENTRDPMGFQETQSLLSLGIHFQHRNDIKDTQIETAMKTYISGSSILEINYKNAFESDPVLDLNKSHRFIVDVYGKKSDRLRDDEKMRKQLTLRKLNDLKTIRCEQKISFEDQLRTEYLGEYQNISYVLSRLIEYAKGNCDLTSELFSQCENILCLLIQWDMLGGNKSDKKPFLSFFTSEEWEVAPYNDIQAHLYAKLVTKYGEVKSGDPMDVSQLTIALIYCDYIICDKSMRNIIKELELDKKYNANVFSISDYEDIIKSLSI